MVARPIVRIPDTQEVFGAALDRASNDNAVTAGPSAALGRRLASSITALREGDFEQAERELMGVLKSLEDGPVRSGSDKVRSSASRQKELTYRTLAHAKLERLEVAEAVELYKRGYSALESAAPAERWQYLHDAASQLQKYASLVGRKDAAAHAVEFFRRSQSFAPDIGDAQNDLGMALTTLGGMSGDIRHLVEAEEQFKAALTHAARDSARSARIQINLAGALWKQGERAAVTSETRVAKVAEALALLDTALAVQNLMAAELARAEDNRGNAVMVLGRTEEAITAYKAALGHLSASPESRDTRIARARSLNNLGTAYAEALYPLDEALAVYDEALALLQALSMPRERSRIQHNIGDSLSKEGERLSEADPRSAKRYLENAVRYYDAALEVRQRNQNPSDWAVSTVNLAYSLRLLGELVGQPGSEAEQATALGYLLRSVGLCCSALTEPALPDRDRAAVVRLYEAAATAAQSAWDIFEYTFRLPIGTTITSSVTENITKIARRIHGILEASGLPEAEWPAVWQELNREINHQENKLPDELVRRNQQRFELLNSISDKIILVKDETGDKLKNSANLDTRLNLSDHDQIIQDVLSVLASSTLPKVEWPKVLSAALDKAGMEWPTAAMEATRGQTNRGLAAEDSPKLQLPDKAPKLYADRPKGRNIIDFLRDPEGWGPYVAAGVLSRPDLNRLDPQAYRALAQWLHFNKVLPSDLRIPTKSEALPKEFETPEAVRAAARVTKRAYRQRITNL